VERRRTKPFTQKIPVDDKPYTFSLATAKTKIPEDLVTVDQNLVNLGIETLKLGFYPYDNKMNVTLATKKDKPVAVTLSFLNEKGVPVWQETVTAPVEKQFEIKPPMPGTKWVITPAGKTLEAVGITSITYYPNPFNGKLTVNIQTKDKKIPVQVTLDDMMGNRVADVKLTAPVEQAIEVKGKAGYYVLSFLAGGASKKVWVELRD